MGLVKVPRFFLLLAGIICAAAFFSAPAKGQSPGPIYTWEGTGDVQGWVKNFGANSVVLDNVVDGELRITETGIGAAAGATVAISDGPNRVRESSVFAAGGTDLTGLEFLEFELGHSGEGVIDVQFYVQASPNYTYKALGPDIPVLPGVNTYQVPIFDLLPEELVYIRTFGFNARDHFALGNVVWTLSELRVTGEPLEVRELVTHDIGTAENGLEGAIVNFDNSAVAGNTGQNQTGLSQNTSGSGSLQWIDLGGSVGAAITWGNGTPWNGNTFNNRTADLSNYDRMIVRISAAEVILGDGGFLDIQAFFQVANFNFQVAEGGVAQALPIDGQFHDLVFSLADLGNMNVVDQTGINLGFHPTDLRINVDSIIFIPEPGAVSLLTVVAGGFLGMCRSLSRTRQTGEQAATSAQSS
jgi:hypothetical protein